jgi:Protein of unknown function (DUF2934)
MLTRPQKQFARVTPISNPAELENKITERARQLYEAAVVEPGEDQQDWAWAEDKILNQRA